VGNKESADTVTDENDDKTIVGYYYEDDEGGSVMVTADKLPTDNDHSYTPVYSDDEIISNTKGGLQLLNPAIESTLTELTFQDYENYKSIYDNFEETSVYSELESTKILDVEVTPVLTTANYFDNNNIKVQGGFTEKMCNKNQRTAIISKTFANEHFYGKTAVNQTFKLNDKRYKVVGIYDDKSDTFNDVFKDNKERIYLNYTGYEGYEEEVIDAISWSADSKIAREMQKSSFVNFQKLNYDEKNLAVDTFGCILLFVLSVTAIVYLMKLWFANMSNIAKFFKSKMSKGYLENVLVHNAVGIALRLLAFVSLPALMVLSVVLSFTDFHIVESYIHKENLFNISYMIDTLISTLQRENGSSFGGNPYFFNLYNGTLAILFIFTVVIVVLFFIWFYMYCQLGRENTLKRMSFIAVFFVVTIVSMISCFVNGTSYIFFTISGFLTGIMILKFIRDRVIKKG
jgi:hypothetical protein